MAALAFDYTPGRPENIDQILNGLDRYNPETTTIFQDYVSSQCENQTYDCYANLALLKLYQFNPHLTRDETTTNILVKALTIFPSPDFSLCLSLLPPYVLKDSKATGATSSGTLAEAVQYLDVLHNQLNNAQYTDFWSTLDSSDLYADLTADVHGFEDIMRLRIAMVVSQCMQQVGRKHLESWLNVEGAKFETFCRDICGWTIEEEMVIMPSNKDNEARSVVQGEKVKFDQFSRLIKRAYEQPA